MTLALARLPITPLVNVWHCPLALALPKALHLHKPVNPHTPGRDGGIHNTGRGTKRPGAGVRRRPGPDEAHPRPSAARYCAGHTLCQGLSSQRLRPRQAAQFRAGA